MTRLAIVLAAALLVTGAHADLLDTASDPAYNDGWQGGDNGGSGFGAWAFGGSAAGRTSIASSSGNGGGTTIDSSGESFRLSDTDNSGAFIDVFRFLSTDLQVGETFSIDIDVNFRGGFKGIRFRDTDDSTSIFRFEVGNPGTGDDYIVYDAATGNGSIGNAYSSDSIFAVSVTQTSGAGGTWAITRSGGLSDLDAGTYNGRVSSVQLFTFLAGNTAEQAIYYNNLKIVPEPATAGLVLTGLAIAAGIRHVRTRRTMVASS